jgi:uncharacterized protein (TIGR04255 family)
MMAPHLGLLWARFKPDFDRCQEAHPFMLPIEPSSKPAALRMQFDTRPPLPRIWFLKSDGNAVIQVQRDTFFYNWRHGDGNQPYPHFSQISSRFREHLQQFEEFLETEKVGRVTLKQCDLKYTNELASDGDFDLGRFFPDFEWKSDAQRFLPLPSAENFRLSFKMPDSVGQLHVVIRRARRSSDQREVLILELNARGVPANSKTSAMWDWFDLAHEWIVRGFADLTSRSVQIDLWKRKDV